MKNYCFEGLLTVGTGKIDFLSGFDNDNHADFPSSCPKDFACVHFDSQESVCKGLYRICISECASLSEAFRLLKSLFSDYQLDFYSSSRYTCYSSGSAKITRSVRYLRDNFDFESV